MRLITILPIALLANSAICAPYRPHVPSPATLIRTPLQHLRFGENEPGKVNETSTSTQTTEIISSIKTLNTYIQDLNKAYAGFNGRAEEALGLVAVSDKLYKQVEKIISEIDGHNGEFTLLEAANVGTAFMDFMPSTVTAISGLKDKKDLFDKMGGTPVLVQELKKQRDQADRLKKALKNKIPEIGKDTADALYGDVSDSFSQAIDFFSKSGAAEWNAGTEASAEDLMPS